MTNSLWKPDEYNSASPYFIVAGAQKFIDLMKQVFEAKDLRRYERPDGSIAHAEIQIYDSVIMLCDATDKFPPVPMVMHVYVPDVDQTINRASAAGCEIMEQPGVREGDPDRRGTFRDFNGNIWSVGT